MAEPRGSDAAEFEEMVRSYYKTIDPSLDESGESTSSSDEEIDGALMFAVCRGKVSEGMDFADNFARAVITVSR